MDFHQKIILITGASSGIGEALAHALAARGAYLILASRRRDVLEQVRTRLNNAQQHKILVLDLAQPEAAFETIQRFIVEHGPVDLLINSGGVSQRSFAAETPLSVDRTLMEVNFLGTVAVTKAVLPSMQSRNSGTIVTVSSVAGKVGSQMRSSYSAAKHALMGFMDSLRAEVWKHGVRVIVVCPGWVRTHFSLSALNALGEAQNVMDKTTANGISAQQCAQKIIEAIERNKPEIVVGKGLSRLAPTIRRFSPGLYRWLIGRKVYR